MVRTSASPLGWLLRVLLALLVAASGLPALATTATAEGESVTITPETQGDTAVRAGQFVRVSGTAPAGEITSAALVAIERGGGEVRLALDDGVLNRPATQDTYLRNDGGALSGRLVLGCAFADPKVAVGCSTKVGEVVAVRLDLSVGSFAMSSPPLRVDYIRPTIVGYRVVAPDRIEVRFSEPVRGDDNPTDFTVEDSTIPTVVTAVSATTDDCGHLPPSDGRADRDGCTRILDLLLPLGEDATPLVTYDPVANRPLYKDDASNLLDRSSRTTAARSRAIDVVRPAVPTVDQVDGRTPPENGSVAGRDDTPALRASNLTAGHDVWVERVPANGSPVRGTEVRATGSTAELVAPPLPSDGAHVLRVVARDPSRNLSSESDKQPARADGAKNPVTYVLDTVVPTLLTAVSEGERVRVLFSEPVSGPDDPDDFAVRFEGQDRPVTAVEGSGNSRLLTVTGGAPAGSVLDYAPGQDGRYADAAGNPVPDQLDLPIAGVSAPRVDIPAGQLFTASDAVAVGGSLPSPREAGTVVEVLRDNDRNGSADGEVLATAAVGSDGRWATQVALTPDSRNDFVVRARTPSGLVSPLSPVPTVVQDGTVPALTLLQPDGGEILAGGRETPVRWSTSDTNPDTVLVELSTDGVSFTEAVRTAAAASGEQSVQVVLPDVDTDAARVRLTATDRAGNSTVDLSGPFTIDAIAPAFSAVTELLTATDGRIRVLFTEPVSGPIAPGDFSVDGEPAVVETVDGSGSTPVEANQARFLVLRTNRFDPDAQPDVSYTPKQTGELVDRAGQGIEVRGISAADGIRPPTPSIDSAGGRPVSGDSAVAADATPDLTVSGLTPGHTVFVERLTSGGGAQAAQERTAGSDGRATVPAPALPGDGEYPLRAVVRDLNDNLSTEVNKNPSPADSGPSQITYVLDTAAPRLLEAVSAGDQVTVLFSEGVTGTNSAADWAVDGCMVDAVAGDDGARTRALTVSGCDTPARRTLTYAPQDEGRRYVDRAASPVPNSVLTVDGIRVPTVTLPGAPAVTPDPTRILGGTSQPGTVVDVFRDSNPGDDTDSGDVAVVRGLTLDSSSRWSTSVDLVRDAVNAFYVQARSPTGEFRDSPQVPVPAITQDSLDPAVDLTRPTGGEVLAGGASSTAEWTTSDANPSSLLVEISTNGTDFSPIATRTPPANGEDSAAFQVPDVDTAAARVRVTATDQAGRTSSEISAPFTIDALAPTFSAATNTFQGSPREVRVTFSEPVSGTLNAATDFRVNGAPAAVFTEAGSPPPPQVSNLRALVLRSSTDFGPDGTPQVTYTPTVGQLVDRAGQGIEARLVTAVDAIRPPTPQVEQVQGRAPDGNDRVVGSAAQPSLTVSNVSEGHVVVVRRVPAGGAPVDGPSTRATGSTVTVPAPPLPADGEHVLTVVVTDPAGNVSTDGTKNPAPADRGPSTVRYVLDRLVPSLLTASVEDGRLVARFSEAVSGTNDERHWRLVTPDGQDRPVTGVEGSGSSRILTVDGGTPGGSRLSYAPTSGRYVDVAGNAVPDASVLVTGLPGPVVLVPAADVFVTTPSTEIRGTDVGGSTVLLYRDDDNDGRPDGEPVASDTTRGSDAAWGFTVQLRQASVNRFVVVAQRSDGSRSDHVRVPSITHDDVAPVLDVRGLPGDAQVRRPGSAYEFVWRTCDANLGATPMTFEFTLDGGATWSRFGQERYASANDCDVENRRPVTLPGVDSRDAQLRVTSTDLSGRTATVTSPRFVLDGPTEVRDVRRFACPPDRVRPAGFTDTATSTFRFEIDCLAAYSFTKGVTADRYDPLNTVTRAQMAMFVSRVAGYAGVPLDTSDAGFTDMGGRPQETRDAVNALANLGVVQGVGGGRYAPGDPVSRGQMASFLARVQKQVGAPFTLSRNAFGDDDGTTHEANIDLIAAAGVVQGVRPGVYQPLASITRQQMAGFLTRYVDGQIEAGEMRSVY